MAEKHITLAQLRESSLRTKTEVLALLIDALEGVQVSKTITLSATGWSGGVQTVKDSSFLADSSYCYFVFGDIGVDADDITVEGQITFQSEDTPDRDLTVTVIRLEVDTEDTSNVGQVFNLTSNENLKTYIDVRFGDFHDALINERPIYFGLCDSDNKALLDSDEKGVAGRVIFQIK